MVLTGEHVSGSGEARRRVLMGRGNSKSKTTRGQGGCWECESDVCSWEEGSLIAAGDKSELLAGQVL